MRRVQWSIAASILLVTACRDLLPTELIGDHPAAVVNAGAPLGSAWIDSVATSELLKAAQGRRLTIEDELLRIEIEAPAFAGLYFDTMSSHLVALVTDEAQAERVLSAVRNNASSRQDAELMNLSARGVAVQRATLPFSRLVAWKQVVSSRARSMGVIYVDANEATGRLDVGVRNADSRSQVAASLQNLGLPSEVTSVKVMRSPVALQSNLRSTFTNPIGGIQVTFRSEYVGSYYSCTLGLNIITYYLMQAGFLTASHCQIPARHGLGITGDSMFQAVPTNRHVGYISVNPPWDVPCGLSARCTLADAMFVGYLQSIGPYSRVSKTNGLQAYNNTPGTRARSSSWANILGNTLPLMGTPADKVGRTTGWTRGTHTATCVGVVVNEGTSDEYAVTCAHTVETASVGQGDSGAPVFRESTSQTVYFLGVLFAGFVHVPDEDGNFICDNPGDSFPPPNDRCRYYYSDRLTIESHIGRTFMIDF